MRRLSKKKFEDEDSKASESVSRGLYKAKVEGSTRKGKISFGGPDAIGTRPEEADSVPKKLFLESEDEKLRDIKIEVTSSEKKRGRPRKN